MNPEEQNLQGLSEQPVAPQEVNIQPEQTQSEAPQVEATAPVQTEPMTTAQPEATTPARPIPSTSTVPEGKKGKSWIIILVIILLLLLALFGAIWWTSSKIGGAFSKFADEFADESSSESNSGSSSGSGSGTVMPVEDNPIIAANDKMRNELGSFHYLATMTSEAMGMTLGTNMECDYDGKNSLEHCMVYLPMDMTQEIYLDWANGYEYTKMNASLGIIETDDSWTKNRLSTSTNGVIDISNGNNFSIISTEETDKGTQYTGEIGGFTYMDTGNGSLTDKGEMGFVILVNKDGYIESIELTTHGDDIKQLINIEYKDFGAAPSISIPEEALKAE